MTTKIIRRWFSMSIFLLAFHFNVLNTELNHYKNKHITIQHIIYLTKIKFHLQIYLFCKKISIKAFIQAVSKMVVQIEPGDKSTSFPIKITIYAPIQFFTV